MLQWWHRRRRGREGERGGRRGGEGAVWTRKPTNYYETTNYYAWNHIYVYVCISLYVCACSRAHTRTDTHTHSLPQSQKLESSQCPFTKRGTNNIKVASKGNQSLERIKEQEPAPNICICQVYQNMDSLISYRIKGSPRTILTVKCF